MTEINIKGVDYTPVELGELMGKLLNDFAEAPQPAPAARNPTGKGLLIWQLRVVGTDPVALAAKCKDLNLAWVSIKVVDGINSFNDAYIAPTITELRKVGIDVWGWGYTYGNNPVAEGSATATILNSLDVSGYMIDAEGQYDRSMMGPTATAYVNNIRAKYGKPLGLCSYRYPNLHNNFPWNQFLAQIDFHCPQVYWIQAVGDTVSGYQLGRSYNQLQALKVLPFIPIGTIVKDDFSAWVPSVPQIQNFSDTAKQLNLPGYGYYDLDSGLPQLLDVIKSQ